MSCEVGPAEKRFGGLPWHLYSCADRTTLIVYPARGNPAKAYFVFRRAGAAYQMVGEVGADKEVAGPAIEELKRLDPGQIIGLIAETRGDAFKATPDDEAQVKAVTERYFAARQTGDWRTAYDLLSPGLKEMSTFEAWRAAGQDFEAKAGRFVRRRLKRLTWYDNPGDAPEPGVYVAVDYEAEYKKLAVDCGYLMWLRGGDGGYRLMRQEDSVLERSLRETIDETSYKAFRAQYCRDPQ